MACKPIFAFHAIYHFAFLYRTLDFTHNLKKNRKILIDFPVDTYMHYLKWNIPLDKIKTCIITHSHSDHLYPIEIEMRINGYAHISSGEPLTFYSAESGYEMLKSVVERYNISENDIVLKLAKPFDVIFLDCTQANDPIVPYVWYLNLNKCIALRDEFIKGGIADEKTKFLLNHFSHKISN